MSEINSIANGTYVIGQTSATNFQAGPGISITQPSEGTVRIANDETVLWETDRWEPKYPSSLTLSEDPHHFKEIQVLFGSYGSTDGGNNMLGSISFQPDANRNGVMVLHGVMRGAAGLYYNCIDEWSGINTTAWSWVNGKLNDFGSTGAGANNMWCSPYKIIGKNRISANA